MTGILAWFILVVLFCLMVLSLTVNVYIDGHVHTFGLGFGPHR